MKNEQEIKDKYNEMAALVKDVEGKIPEKIRAEALGACDALLWVSGRAEGMLGSLISQIKNESTPPGEGFGAGGH